MGKTAMIASLAALVGVAALVGGGIFLMTGGDFDGADVTVYTDNGVSVDVSGDVMGYTVLKAETAEGTEFRGWYTVDGELLSTDTTYKAKMSEGDTICAYSASYSQVTLGEETDLTSVIGASGGTIVLSESDYDGSSAEISGTTAVFTSAGTYRLLYTDEDEGKYVCLLILADGEIEVTYEWEYSTSVTPVFDYKRHWHSTTSSSNTEYSLTLSVLYSDYLHYVNAYTDDERICYYSNYGDTDENIAHDTSFVNYDEVQDPYIEEIADYISSSTTGKSDQYVANVILAFVQSITYEYDSDIHGTEEYWQFPLETLFLNSGDCEDTSILFCAIASAMGYDSSMFLFSGHMAAGINLDSFSASRSNGTNVQSGVYGWKLVTGTDESGNDVTEKFYYGETTTEGWLIGEVPKSVYGSYICGFVIQAQS